MIGGTSSADYLRRTVGQANPEHNYSCAVPKFGRAPIKSGSLAILLTIRRASSLLSNLCFYLFRHFAPGPSHFLHHFLIRRCFSFCSQTVTLSSKFAILIRCSHLEIPQ